MEEKLKNISMSSVVQYLRNRELGLKNFPTANLEYYIRITEKNRLEAALCKDCSLPGGNREACSKRMQGIHKQIQWLLYLEYTIYSVSDSDSDV
jgi:hypothetical protein